MPIRFVCEHCGQKLSVSSRVAGRRAKCPKCKETIKIPSESTTEEREPAAVAEEPAHQEAPRDASSPNLDFTENPFAQFAVYDDDEWIYEDDLEFETPKDSRPLDTTKLAVSRNVLYLQGALLGVVAIGCFIFGIVVGAAMAPQGAGEAEGPMACVIKGKLAYLEGGKQVPDEGAVVIVLPQDARPDPNAKVPIDTLRPEVTPPNEDDLALRQIRELGGDYTRANEGGEYELRVPDRGAYFVLFLSNNARLSHDEQPEESHLAQMGRYFLFAEQLIGSNCYEWRDETVRHDRTLSFLF
jgi:phage FluMu protein Com